MKLKFKNQQFQTDAVDSVADLFKGQEKLRSTFEITNIEAIDLINQNELGIGNVISISNDALLANMKELHTVLSVLKWKRVRVKPMFTQRLSLNLIKDMVLQSSLS